MRRQPKRAWSILVAVSIVGVYAGAAAAQICSAYYEPHCTDTTTTANYGRWPGGVIYYEWGTGGDPTPISSALKDWEAVAAHAIRFEFSNTHIPRVKINMSYTGGLSPGYDDCARLGV